MDDLFEYEVVVSFCGFVGGDISYTVAAADEEDAENEAIELAKDDLEVNDIVQTADDEWEVTIGFGGLLGVEENYSVNADSEEEAIEEALELAADDLSAEFVDLTEYPADAEDYEV